MQFSSSVYDSAVSPHPAAIAEGASSWVPACQLRRVRASTCESTTGSWWVVEPSSEGLGQAIELHRLNLSVG